VKYGGVIVGRRDYRHREPKKAKKDVEKLPHVGILTTPANVEVIKKARKGKEGEEAER
jgi:hypothetical protein